MEQYKASIESVDTALHRLNQTLAAYRLSHKDASVVGSVNASRPHESGNGPNLSSSETLESSASIAKELLAESNDTKLARGDVRREICKLRSSVQYPQKLSTVVRLERLRDASALVQQDPYCMPTHLFLAIEYLGLGYPDLAIGSAYKALQLWDAISNESDEYHEVAMDAMETFIKQVDINDRLRILRYLGRGYVHINAANIDTVYDIELYLWTKWQLNLIMYRVFVRSLLLCNCLKSAHVYLGQFLAVYPEDPELLDLAKLKQEAVETLSLPSDIEQWPDGGLVRREVYPWNHHEPNRLQELDTLNEMMSEVSTKLEVCAVDLPNLFGAPGSTITQLGVFAKEDIAPGEIVLDETSMLTANNKLQDALCDACSADLPDLDSDDAQNVVGCPDCEVVFCSSACLDRATESYHPALCDKDVQAIAKDVPPQFAADSLYTLLLLRALAMAETQGVHPLDLREVRYIWGDFLTPPTSIPNPFTDLDSYHSCTIPRTLPFSFRYNVQLPYHMLEKMDVDIFARPEYDVWVLNTLFAKFRGTASARLSGLGGRTARGPEVSAVHPMWCLANHSCDPNVSWEWGGSIQFWAREERMQWQAVAAQDVKKKQKKSPGIRKGEEVLNHYCDVNLPVQERREWAQGALGGDCLCERCVWEAAQQQQQQTKADVV